MKDFLLTTNCQVKQTNKYLPSDEKLTKLADFFDMFRDVTRLKIISCLSLGSCCVSDLAKLIDINQTTLSHQLKTLKSQNIIKSQRNGKIIIYSLKDKLIDQTMLCAVNFCSAN